MLVGTLAQVDGRGPGADDVTMQIADKKVVRMDYTLRNKAGEVLDSSEGQDPLSYLHGAQQIVPGLERALTGMSAGESKDVVVSPEEGYGLPDPEGVFSVPRNAFPADAKLEPGTSFIGEDEQGHAVPVRVVEVREGQVVVDANHPLAGETLYFHVDIRDVRDATLEELTHGHVHGPGGHEEE
jgi:FKBP-type peptidyl-prolyl cis-trans isomerase SlyD